jgi:FkbM family methyltransferase
MQLKNKNHMNSYKYRQLAIKILDLLGIDKTRIKRFIYGFEVSFNECNLVVSFIKKYNIKGTIIDVGFFNGGSTIELIENGWLVYGFEPDKDEYKIQSINKIKKYSNFIFDDRAVSDMTGDKMKFYISNESKGISSLHEFTKGHVMSHEVYTIRLDDYMKTKNISEVVFLKIDTEGHDLFVLHGFPFDKIKPMIILAEYEDRKTNRLKYSYKDIADLFINNQYYVYLFEWYPVVKYGGNHKFRKISEYPCELIDKDSTGNILAIRKDCITQFKEYLKEQEVSKYF